MNATTDLTALVERTRASEFADGLREITIGTLFSFVSVAIVATRSSPPEIGAVGAVVLAAVILATDWGITQLRLRWIWPHGGYVRLQRGFIWRYQAASLIVIVAAMVVLMSFLILVTGHPNRIAALTLALVLFSWGQWRYFGQTRILIAGMLSAFVALLVTIVALSADGAFLAVSLSFGLCTLAGGLVALVRTLRGLRSESIE